jgi:hypothetical protein
VLLFVTAEERHLACAFVEGGVAAVAAIKLQKIELWNPQERAEARAAESKHIQSEQENGTASYI